STHVRTSGASAACSMKCLVALAHCRVIPWQRHLAQFSAVNRTGAPYRRECRNQSEVCYDVVWQKIPSNEYITSPTHASNWTTFFLLRPGLSNDPPPRSGAL